MLLLLLVVLCTSVLGNQYDPHLYPAKGPYFEGWYIRMIDHKSGESYAALFGQVLPEDPATAANNTMITILRTDGDGRLQSYEAFPSDDSVKVTVNGNEPVTGNPVISSPPNFEWRSDPYGFMLVKPDYALINFTIGDVSLLASIGRKNDWMYNKDFGPEGWLSYLPLPLAWFVYSTASETDYRYQDRSKGINIEGKATSHMEKNWGKAFPTGWFWTEGHRPDGVTFAMSGGPIKVARFAPQVVGHLIGYENKQKNIALNFRPDNSVMDYRPNECFGALKLTVTGPFSKLELDVTTPEKSFSNALYGPSVKGFRLMCEESFQGTATLRAYSRSYFSWKLIDEQTIEHCALEFGGEYMCAPLDRK